ncbi:molecular chaperone DnaJ [Roseospira marina]|uniref:Molecular chaperone DnaJ n=1 Tax=Roseospira marina TaxID=140057 RepID=A0A5M6IEU9_9PROT|nr:molecular chaperone DnaJ [Roseospira marina]KAA5606255.1 molecular chaperone DnaJ [Roseospira marina]MBB4314411.1 hypothetical protein [Roseospira marina]MBB5087571.1 hypothetical protein [Roseospira marina]
MLPLLILGVILALLVVLLLRGVAAAPTGQLLRVLGWTLGGVLVVVFVLLVVTSRLTWALGVLLTLAPWVVTLRRTLAQGRRFRSVGGGGGGGGRGSRADPDPDDRSDVATRFLAMTLSHATGRMTGTVREGPFAGRALDDLSRDDIALLWHSVQEDPESARLLDAWLDRVHPDWRPDGTAEADEAFHSEGTSAGSAGSGPISGAMSRAEALAVLGLDDGADAEAVKAAHRRLIVLVHPDRGGTPYLAARLNQARDILLGRRASR